MKKNELTCQNAIFEKFTVSIKELKVVSDEYMAAKLITVELSADDDALKKFGIFPFNWFIMSTLSNITQALINTSDGADFI